MTQNINVEAREKLRHSYKEQYRFQAKSLRDLKKRKKNRYETMKQNICMHNTL